VKHDPSWVATDVGLLFAELNGTDLKNPDNWTVVDLPGTENIASVCIYNDKVLCFVRSSIYQINGNALIFLVPWAVR
jgi:hypothetical protein